MLLKVRSRTKAVQAKQRGKNAAVVFNFLIKSVL